MNSLSILSSRVEKVINNPLPPAPQAEAFKELRHQQLTADNLRSDAAHISPHSRESTITEEAARNTGEGEMIQLITNDGFGKTLYLGMLNAWVGVFRWVVSTITFSTSWIASCFYEDGGTAFSALMPLRRIVRAIHRALRMSQNGPQLHGERKLHAQIPSNSDQWIREVDPTSAIIASTLSHPVQHARSKSISSNAPTDEISPRRSIRIRLYNEKSSQATTKPKLASVKSPTSPGSSLRLTKYPRSNGPPRPLLSKAAPKTLILDLDETLIHSLAKGGRMTSGHMVEVKLDRQHAILYYVHKRPYCDEFLRKVCKWYNLVVFTASVQEYADPVIDWLEQDRKYFKARYYRQHCTNRNGAYIKDISAIEPDLSKVVIIDNSPMSYTFHPDNAIPIEGWINDPTDIDLLNLIPLLQALHYVTDVRAFLALRMGEAFS